MLSNHDLTDLLRSMVRCEVRFLVAGGYAVMKYTEPRYTKDLDLWIATDITNARAVYSALESFGAPLLDLTPDDFAAPGHYYKMGKAPNRVDIMMSIPGVEFEDAWSRRVHVSLGDLVVPFMSLDDLILAKEAAGRPQDLLDAERLRSAREE